MNENKEKMKGLIYKLEKRGNARINNLIKIKGQFNTKLNGFSQNASFKLDFSLYKNEEQAKFELFSSVFSISKKISDTSITNVNLFTFY
jgi:hypothetical protein